MNDPKAQAAYFPQQPPGDPMTTNRDRAAEVIWDEQASGIVKPRDLAEALADAGLLMPDLPEPSMAGDSALWVIPGEDGAYDAAVLLAASQIILMINDGDKRGIVSTPSEARGVASALLAAAEYAEKEQK